MGLFTKNIVVMDGSNLDTLYGIIGIIKMMTNDQNKVIWGGLDCNHPTMTVMKFKARKKVYNDIQYVIDECLPGLCTFNVAV